MGAGRSPADPAPADRTTDEPDGPDRAETDGRRGRDEGASEAPASEPPASEASASAGEPFSEALSEAAQAATMSVRLILTIADAVRR
ncbi:hypothetical protein AB0F33_35905, partial [Streptomyces parvus]